MYIDGVNLYYGGRGLCGKGTAGWRWLDVRTPARLVSNHSARTAATANRYLRRSAA
ncbi:hypothetical protein ACNUDN_06058 [Mycobacterium sp. smrl_JER01]